MPFINSKVSVKIHRNRRMSLRQDSVRRYPSSPARAKAG